MFFFPFFPSSLSIVVIRFFFYSFVFQFSLFFPLFSCISLLSLLVWFRFNYCACKSQDLLAQHQSTDWCLESRRVKPYTAVRGSGDGSEILDSFTYLGSAVRSDGGSVSSGRWLSWPAVYWTISTQAHRVVDPCAGQRLGSPGRLCSWSLNTDLECRFNASCNKCLHGMMTGSWDDLDKSTTAPWDWFDAYYLHNLSTATLGIWACGALPRSWPSSSSCFWKTQLRVKEAEWMSLELMAGSSQ